MNFDQRAGNRVGLTTPYWAVPLYESHPVKILSGGRYSAKTWAVAQALVIFGARSRQRIMCTRAVQRTIEHSTKQALESMIRRCGLEDYYNIFEYSIRGVNGTKFMFQGLEGNRESIRGWEGIDKVWVDEAQAVTRETWEILLPTMRKKGSEVWATFNPKRESDYIRKMSKNPEPNWYAVHVTHNDIPSEWISDMARQQIERCLREEPHRYPHIYGGECDNDADRNKVVSYGNVELAMKKYDPKYAVGRPIAGLDLAESEGGDWNCLAIRKGPCVEHIYRWKSANINNTAFRAHKYCLDHGVEMLHYDAGGVGASFLGPLEEIGPPYIIRPVRFGAAVEGPDVFFQYMITNRDFFAKRNSQLYWAVRMRLERLVRLVTKPDKALEFGPEQCLYINVNGAQGIHAETIAMECNRPIWKEDLSSRIYIDKDPDDEGSPDIFDAICLAFTFDSMDGLYEDEFTG